MVCLEGVHISFWFHVCFGVVGSSLECGGRASSLNKCDGGDDRAEQVALWWRLRRGGRAVVAIA